MPPHYDSMVGKLIVHATNRDEALASMRRALEEMEIEGISTTLPLDTRCIYAPDFAASRVDTTWIERVLLPPKPVPTS